MKKAQLSAGNIKIIIIICHTAISIFAPARLVCLQQLSQLFRLCLFRPRGSRSALLIQTAQTSWSVVPPVFTMFEKSGISIRKNQEVINTLLLVPESWRFSGPGGQAMMFTVQVNVRDNKMTSDCANMETEWCWVMLLHPWLMWNTRRMKRREVPNTSTALAQSSSWALFLNSEIRNKHYRCCSGHSLILVMCCTARENRMFPFVLQFYRWLIVVWLLFIFHCHCLSHLKGWM